MTNMAAGGLRPFGFGSTRGLMEESYARNCQGQHDIYVAEVLYVGAEGKLVVVTVCRNCDTVRFHEKIVAEPHHTGELLKKENK